MAQCKKILKDGERCSNRSLPGADYCEKHRRTKFRRISKKQETSKAGSEKPRQSKQKRESPKAAGDPKWTAQPSAAGDSPAFPGLRPDKRNILVAPRGVIRLREKDAEGRPRGLSERLAGLLSHLSREMSLAKHISVWTTSLKSDAMILVVPSDPENENLSRFYDAASSAADMSGGVFYIGEKQAFIQYRDGAAPRGYDAENVRIPKNDKQFYFTETKGTAAVPAKSLTRESLSDLLLSIPPVPAMGADLPETAFALVSRPLYRMLARYFRAHHLHYHAARFHIPGGDSLTLFEISPRADAAAGPFVPAFVISYLTDLPRCTVLTSAESGEERRILVEWGKRCPCLPRNILSAFPKESLLLFTTDPDFSNLCVSPGPVFFDGDDLISVRTPRPESTGATPETDGKNLSLEVPVRLIRDSGPAPFPAALILDPDETEWIRRLLCRFPGDMFTDHIFCMGEERSVLVGKRMPIRTLPFGIPLRRLRDTRLFIPLNTRFTPDLPWDPLSRALKIGTDAYTFLTPEFRMDIPRDAFVPLSRTLVAEPGCPIAAFSLRPQSRLPELKWTPSEKLKKREPEGIFNRFKKAVNRPADKVVLTEKKDVKEALREQARSYHKAGDYLSAALCFAMSDDDSEAAQSYRLAVDG